MIAFMGVRSSWLMLARKDDLARLASTRMEGFDRDPAEEFLRDIATMDMQDISRFYREQISGRPVVYVIAGNRKHIDMKKLAKYGTIIKVKKKDIYK